MDNRYNVNHPSFLGYSLVHGTFIDLRLWKPQSEFWKYHTKLYKDRTGSDVFPSKVFSDMMRNHHSVVNISPSLNLREETAQNLSYIFLDDATNKEHEQPDYPGLNANYRRAEKQMQKYLTLLVEKIRKEQEQ